MIAALLDPGAYDHPVDGIQCLETHISWVLLTGTYAYKIKKPVNLGFVDFSTAERRRWFCQEELRLNRRLAPDLYLGLSPIHGPAERAALAGSGPVIETAVRMRQFPQSALLPAVLDRDGLSPAQLELLADDLAAFHAAAAVASLEDPYGTPDAVKAPAWANAGRAGSLRSGAGPEDRPRAAVDGVGVRATSARPSNNAGARAASGSAMGTCTWATCCWRGGGSRSSTAWSSVLTCAGLM